MPEPKFDFKNIVRKAEKDGDMAELLILDKLTNFGLDLGFYDNDASEDKLKEYAEDVLVEEFRKVIYSPDKSTLMGRIILFLIKTRWYLEFVTADIMPVKPKYEEIDGYINRRFTDEQLVTELKSRFLEIFDGDHIHVIVHQLLLEILNKAMIDNDRPDAKGSLYNRFMEYLIYDDALNEILKTRKD